MSGSASALPRGDQMPDTDDVDISVVMPCLNEARTVGGCVRAAWEGIRSSGLRGEVLVADNGSVDGSREIAQQAGARVVPVPERGYGAALKEGFRAARGRLIVMGDADLSYDFREVPKFVEEQQRTGADIVLGDRLRGTIDAGAMPWTHHHIGNPLISFTIRRLFGVRVNDCYCGLRMITRDAFHRLRLNASSMVFALEMIVQGRLAGLSFAQVPITLHVDGRDHPPHLRTMRDGYRSFRFIFQHAPITAYVVPGVLAALLSLWLLGIEVWHELHGSGVSTAMGAGGTLLLLFGWLVVMLGIISRVFVVGFLDNKVDPPLKRFFQAFRLETAVVVSSVTLLAGLVLSIGVSSVPALVQLGLTLCVIGVGTVLAAFVVSLIGRAIPDDRFTAPPPVASDDALRAAPPTPDAPTPVDPERESSDVHAARVAATRYRRWMLGSLAEAWEGSEALLIVDPTGTFDDVVAEVVASPSGERLTRVSHVPMADELESQAQFDAVLVFGAMAAIDDDVQALRSLSAHVRPGGRVGLLVPAGGERLYGAIDQRMGRVRRYRPARLRQRLIVAGLEPVSVTHVDAIGAVAWYCLVRFTGRRSVSARNIESYERLVPLLRRVDALTGPPFGRLVAAVATVPTPVSNCPAGSDTALSTLT